MTSFELSVVIRTTFLLFVAGMLAVALRRASASTRHAIWTMGLLAAVLLPLVSVVAPVVNLAVLSEPSAYPSSPSNLDGPRTAGALPVQTNSFETARAVAGWPDLPQPVPVSSGFDACFISLTCHPSNSMTGWFTIGWGIGVFVVIIRSLLGLLDVRKLRRESIAVTAEPWGLLLSHLLRELDIRTAVELRIGGNSIPPMTWGIFRPVILFPATAAGWTTERLKAVMAHELGHVKRRDGMIQVLVQIACAIYWFNPLVWVAALRMRIERERACDDQVLNLGLDADDYADHLLQIARGITSGWAFAALSMAHPSQLEGRLRAILDSRTRRQAPSRPVSWTLVSCAVLTTVLLSTTVHLTAIALPLIPHFQILPPQVESIAAADGVVIPKERSLPPVPPQENPSAFVRIQPGEFMMGCVSEQCDADEKLHRVILTREIEMGKYEVTQAEWESVMGTNPSDFKGATLPVEQVSWNDVQEFLNRLNGKRDGYFYRLPTEAEWEYAARAGTLEAWPRASIPRMVAGTPNPKADPISWFLDNSGGQTHPVGTKQPNAWGLYDMIGNVSEWVQDWYGARYYDTSPLNDPQGPAFGESRIMRGGSWDLHIIMLSPSLRNHASPTVKYGFIGFRVVRELQSPQAQSRGAINFMSLEKEIAMGRELAAEVERKVQLVDDSVVTAYIDRIGQTLVRNSDARVPFTFKVVRSDEVNAMALPGGFFYVNSGLILAADDEAELAGVMAHQIAHVTARHGAEQASRGQLLNVATIPLIFSGGPAGFGLRQANGALVPLVFLSFSRNAEKEADFLGLQYAYKTGYDLAASMRFFEKLIVRENANPGTMSKLFSTHPPVLERIDLMRDILGKLPASEQTMVTTPEFAEIRMRLRQ